MPVPGLTHATLRGRRNQTAYNRFVVGIRVTETPGAPVETGLDLVSRAARATGADRAFTDRGCLIEHRFDQEGIGHGAKPSTPAVGGPRPVGKCPIPAVVSSGSVNPVRIYGCQCQAGRNREIR